MGDIGHLWHLMQLESKEELEWTLLSELTFFSGVLHGCQLSRKQMMKSGEARTADRSPA